ncbi:MAG: DUF4124 domain-containing protein [Rhizobacter sp.]
MRALVLFTGALLVCASAHAQTVYRCGPEGRTYSQTPCAQGKAVDVSDDRSAEQRAAAQTLARENQVRGDALERERLHREAGKPATATMIGSRPASAAPAASAAKPKASKKKQRQSKHDNDDFKAIAPAKRTKSQG